MDSKSRGNVAQAEVAQAVERGSPRAATPCGHFRHRQVDDILPSSMAFNTSTTIRKKTKNRNNNTTTNNNKKKKNNKNKNNYVQNKREEKRKKKTTSAAVGPRAKSH